MSTSKQFDKIVAVVLALGILITILFMNGEALGIEKVIDEDAEAYEDSVYFTANDLNGDWDASDATATIELNGTSAKISGNGAYFYDGNVVISGGGYYVFSGTLTGGGIVVDAYSSSKVFVMLNGADITCDDDACLRVDQADKVFLTLAAGTQNSMTSGETYSEQALSDGTGGAIFAHDDLTINGGGSLTITAAYKYGVDANDGLRITGGTITITCPQDGLHVNDSFRFTGAELTIDAGDDGIHSDTDIYIESGTILITECYEGIEAPQIDIAGGDITIYPRDDGFNANGGSNSMGGGNMGGGAGAQGGHGGFAHGDSDGELPDFGDFEGETPDFGDSGGETFERPGFGDFGDFDGEMPERPDAGDFDGELPDWDGSGGGMTEMSGVDSDDGALPCVHISGGNITIINENGEDADGIDSNGDIIITGGTIRVSLVGTGSNSALDYGSENGGVCEISGGTVIACGASGMAESFDATSTQPSILYNISAGAAVGTTVAIEDADGNVLLTWDVPCSFTSMVMSCPEMTLGETYLVVIGDDVEEIALDEVSASYGDAQSGGFGGSMNWGGLQDRGGFGGFGRDSSHGSEADGGSGSGGPGGGRGNHGDRGGPGGQQSGGESPGGTAESESP